MTVAQMMYPPGRGRCLLLASSLLLQSVYVFSDNLPLLCLGSDFCRRERTATLKLHEGTARFVVSGLGFVVCGLSVHDASLPCFTTRNRLRCICNYQCISTAAIVLTSAAVSC
jgi:hypothetical protein